jgi:predicted RNase H-like HicB family nuclease
MDYIAYLHKDRDSDFGVSFPDFPGCVTAGKTLDEARRLAEIFTRMFSQTGGLWPRSRRT